MSFLELFNLDQTKKNADLSSGVSFGGQKTYSTSSSIIDSYNTDNSQKNVYVINSPNATASPLFTEKKTITTEQTSSPSQANPFQIAPNVLGSSSAGGSGGGIMGNLSQILIVGALVVGAVLIIPPVIKSTSSSNVKAGKYSASTG